MHARYLGSHNAAANGRQLAAPLDLQFDGPAGKKTKNGLDQRAVRRDIDDGDLSPRSYASLKNAKVRDGASSGRQTAVG
jgi:hypothetical protein